MAVYAEASEFVLPTRVVFGEGCSRAAGEHAAGLGARHALLVTDAGVLEAGAAEGVAGALGRAGLAVTVFDRIDPNPRVASVRAGADVARAAGCDVLVAVGGGSVIDTAKAIGLVLVNGGDVVDYDFTLDEPRPIERPITRLVAVPTTAGTGSEVTFWAVVTDPERREKLGVGGPLMAPAVALVDPELTLTLSPALTAFTGLDALTHAVEALAATNASPFSDLCALRAVSLVATSLRRAVADGGDRAARRDMALASSLAGAAFTNADVGAVHCIAEVVGGLYDLPHGLVCALYLPPVVEFSAAAAPERYAAVAEALGVTGGEGDAARTPSETVVTAHDTVGGAGAERTAALVAPALRRLARDLGVPTAAAAGVRAADHERIAVRCVETIGEYAVPRPLLGNDFLAVLRAADGR
ncbi:MAG: iron-containing alcohol dehydrogenase [Thermoleophilia bacterium]|nr:iron-containing alcohol dehydrogenase [Thermoleophilia bacterium]